MRNRLLKGIKLHRNLLTHRLNLVIIVFAQLYKLMAQCPIALTLSELLMWKRNNCMKLRIIAREWNKKLCQISEQKSFFFVEKIDASAVALSTDFFMFFFFTLFRCNRSVRFWHNYEKLIYLNNLCVILRPSFWETNRTPVASRALSRLGWWTPPLSVRGTRRFCIRFRWDPREQRTVGCCRYGLVGDRDGVLS